MMAFPSPCGDVVLKLGRTAPHSASYDVVSVPLRGCGFEIANSGSVRSYWRDEVSVPLRGCGFEILNEQV